MERFALLVWFAVTLGTFAGSTSERGVAGRESSFPAAPVPAGLSIGARENRDKGLLPHGQLPRTQGPSCTDCSGRAQ